MADIQGTNLDEALDGTVGDDTISSFAGNDLLNGLEGADTLFGGNGNDVLNGGADSNSPNGGADDDRLIGGMARIRCPVGKGADCLEDNDGAKNTLLGGDRYDTLLGNGTLDGGNDDDIFRSSNSIRSRNGDETMIPDDVRTENKFEFQVSRPILLEGDGGTTEAEFEVSQPRPALEGFTVDDTTIFQDENTRQSYYPRRDRAERGRTGQAARRHHPSARHAVEAFIRTADRTPIAYLVKPLSDYFTKAFRE